MSRPIFHSLGSNYSLVFALLALKQLMLPKQPAPNELTQKLNQEFGGESFLLYKGRDAIEFALKVLQVKTGDRVLTQAFSCHAIEEGIVRSGALPIYVDIDLSTINPSLRTIEATATKITDPIKALIIQHTLGNPAELAAMRDWCHQKEITLIEDVAQAFGAKNDQQQGVGLAGEIIICSFGRDKILDAISGGAVIFKRAADQRIAHQLYAATPANVSLGIVAKDLTYPLLTWVIRRTHSWGLGKVLFQLAKAVGWLTSPIAAPTQEMKKLPAAYVALVLEQWRSLTKQLAHRRQIAQIYQAAFASQSFAQPVVAANKLEQATNLRWSLVVDHPNQLAQKLRKKNIYLTDRWYRQAVDYGSLAKTTVYKAGSCLQAENLAQHIFNLPTHRYISPADAQRIVTKMKEVIDV